MADARFSDDEWLRVWACLRENPGIYVRQEVVTRRFVEAVLWMARAGAPWRLLPAEFGPWNSAYKRFARWQGKGGWQMLMDRLSADGRPRVADARQHHRAQERGDPSTQWPASADAGGVRAHACAAGAKKSEGEQCLGRSRGGWSSKLHGLGDSLGNPLRCALTAGAGG